MALPSVSDHIRTLLGNPGLLEKRAAFVAKCQDRFAAFFQQFDKAVADLREGSGPIKLLLFDTLPQSIAASFDALSPGERGLLAKELVARGLARLPDRLEVSQLPTSILTQYPVSVDYMIRSIVEESDERYGNRTESYLDRDLRMAEGLTVPAGAQVIDLRAWLSRSFYRYQGPTTNLQRAAFVFLRLGGLGPLLRIHTDTRNLLDFNAAGWNACYARIADLMHVMPEVKGMVGTSWFYDPQLSDISPNLRYLRAVPTESGAFLRIDGPGEIHTQRAITRSQTRKKLYEEGRYLPICATLVWRRKRLLAWAKHYRYREG